jgi:23S rRNA pseudouridine2605 synthase
MPKANSGNRSSGRRGSPRNSSDKKSTHGSNKSFGAKRPGSKSGDDRREFKPKSSTPFRKKDSFRSGGDSSRNERSSGEERRDNRRGGTPSQRPRRSNFDKPQGARDSRSSSFDRKRSGEGSSRPFDKKRSGEGSSRPFPKRRSEEGSTRSFDRKRSGERSTGSFDRKRSEEGTTRPFDQKGSDKRAPRKSFDKNSRDERPKKSFDSERPRRSDSRSFDKKRSSDRAEKPGGFFDKNRRGKETSHENSDTSAPAQTEKIRLNRYIANSGVCSRREADELIKMGLVSVNGQTITELGYKVNPGDEVRYENRILRAEKPVYILLNKPKGYLTTTDDPQERNTVMQIVGSAVKERIYPVGRLDRNTTGLLLLTNDGDLADKLMHPSYNVKKIYKVELDKPLSKPDFDKILEGVRLEEGRAMVDDLAIVSDDGKTVGIELHIGWNRVVRRIFESLDYQVLRLDRSVYAGLDKKDLGRGEWRYLSKEEVVRLKHFK